MGKFTRKQNLYHAASRSRRKFRTRTFQPSLVFSLGTLLTLVLFFTGCKSKAIESPQNILTREITDDLGRRVKISEKIERAVSLAPNLTEIVFAVGAGERLVGVTTYCDYPLEAREIRKIGDTINPNIESVIALNPQIVLISTASQIESFTKQLEARNIAVFVTNPNTLDDIYKSIERVGKIFGKTERAREIVDNLQKRVADIETKTNSAGDVKVFLQISKEPLYTIGKDSFLTDLIRRAGGTSATADLAAAYSVLSKETALLAQPEAIILSESDDNLEPNDVFKNSPAVENGRVFHINAELLSRPGPRVVDGLEQMAKALHPENFK
ncbi:MAG: cobalamin-binding protein [Acidobacteriota bacterium]|nr:cobalamin-binding protein [Acidobacteriota bacterium]